MNYSTLTKSLAAAAATLSLMTSSVASAAPITAKTVDPLVALSILGSSASQAALCASGAVTVAGSAAAAQAQTGCVLPVVDTTPITPPAAVSDVPPPVMAEPVAVGPGPNLLPLFLVLAGMTAAFFLLDDVILGDDDDDDIEFDVSPA